LKVGKFAALVSASLVAAMLIPSTTASANHNANLDIQAGEYLFETKVASGESMRFFPADLTVHKGDTLTFRGDFHTALFLPTSATDADAWIAENATAPDDPYSFIKGNPDNQTYPLKLWGDNPFTPAPCGSEDAPCAYGGDEVIDSGLLFNYYDFSGGPDVPPVNNGFTVTVDANPGDVFWVICGVHPKMRMRVVVVGPNEDSTTQESIDTYTTTTVNEDRRAATELHESMSSSHPSQMVDGKKVWTAFAGYDAEDFSLFGMYPKKINVKRGQSVEWRFASLNFEVHTATLANKKARRLGHRGQPILCDPNGDGESGGETMPPPEAFPPQCSEGAAEQVLAAQMLSVVGDGTFKNVKDLENSGVRGAMTPTRDPYVLKIGARSGSTYTYLCAIHPFMIGKIRVK